MEITPRDTVGDVMLKNWAIFNLGRGQIYEAVKDAPAPAFIPMRRRCLPDKKLKTRSVNVITVQELDAIRTQADDFEYFETCLAVMLGIDKKQVRRLCFLRACRYFIEVRKELEKISGERKPAILPPVAAEAAQSQPQH